MLQAEGMAQLMSRGFDDEAGGKKGIAAVLAPSAAEPCHAPPTQVVVGAVVDDDEQNAASGIKGRLQISEYVADADHAVRAQIAGIGVRPVHAMHYRVALVVGFILEGFGAVAARLHLVAVKGLNAGNPCFYGVDHVGVERAVVGNEVDQLHVARLVGVRGEQLGGRTAGVIALQLLGVEGPAGIRPVDWGG